MPSTVETAIRSTVTRGVGMLAGYNRRRLAANGAPHPFLSGVHEPMTEEKTLVDLTVTGTDLPPEPSSTVI